MDYQEKMDDLHTDWHEKYRKRQHTISFFARNNIPVVRTVTHSRIIVDVQPHKEDPIRVKPTVGGGVVLEI